MNLTLPASWRGKERRFTQLLAHELALLPVSESQRMERLSLQPIQINSGESYTLVAKRVANQVYQQINSPQVSQGVSQSNNLGGNKGIS